MKTFRQIKEECANSVGCAVRGLGNVTGTPKVGEEGVSNPHIERIGVESTVNNQVVHNWIKNNTEGLYSFDSDDWWEDSKGKKARMKSATKSFTRRAKGLNEGMESDHYKAIDDVHINLDNRNHAIEDYGYGPLNPKEPSEDFWKEKADLWETSVEEAKKSRCGNCAAFNQSKEILNRIAKGLGPVGHVITEKADLGFCEMFHFKCAAERTCDAWLVNGPIKEEIGGAVIGGGTVANAAGSGNIAGLGTTQVGKPANWGEPGVSPKKQAKHKVLTRAKPNEVGSALKEIPISEVKTGMFASEQTFIVPETVYERALYEKVKGKHWRTYIMDSFIHPSIREFANKYPHKPIIFENEKTGYMCYARYGKKGK